MEEIKNLKQLSVDHPYCCSDTNYYSNDASMRYDGFPEFLQEWKDSDLDYNLCFRWDIKEKTDSDDNLTGKYEMEIFMILQRKGIFMPIKINRVFEEDLKDILEWLNIRKDYLISLWNPIT